ncbi:MAG TPA: aminotransferase class IV [Coriobacteriia bacterium]
MRPTTLRETILAAAGRLPLLAYHLERLAEGGVPTAQLAEVRARVREAAREHAAASKLQVVVEPGGGCSIHPSAEASSLDVPGGPAIVPVTVAALPALPPHAAKPADRAYWDGPQRLAQLRGGQQAVLVTSEGDVVDGGTATVWAVEGEMLVTPPAPPAVAGVARRVILRELATALGLRVDVRRLPLAELLAADEILLSNAVGGLVAAAGRGGKVASRLAVAFARVLAPEEDVSGTR